VNSVKLLHGQDNTEPSLTEYRQEGVETTPEGGRTQAGSKRPTIFPLILCFDLDKLCSTYSRKGGNGKCGQRIIYSVKRVGQTQSHAKLRDYADIVIISVMPKSIDRNFKNINVDGIRKILPPRCREFKGKSDIFPVIGKKSFAGIDIDVFNAENRELGSLLFIIGINKVEMLNNQIIDFPI
jgi:hypothetical protein